MVNKSKSTRKWYDWLMYAGVAFGVLAVAFLITGIWTDERWSETGCVFIAPGFICLMLGSIFKDEDY